MTNTLNPVRWLLAFFFWSFRISFGGDSSSSSSSQQTTNNTDNRRTLGQGAVSAESGAYVNVQTMDADVANKTIAATTQDLKLALNNNQQVVSNALDFASSGESAAFDFARRSATAAYDSLQQTSQLVSNAYADAKGRGALTDKILIGAIVAMALVAAMAVKRA